ncbi:MAG: hypothetical protein AAB453_03300 [Patescibacteria group bacterium]
MSIEQGAVYNFSGNKTIPNHYFVVINKNPKKDREIYLVSFTTKKENAVRHIKHFQLNMKTYVEVAEGECDFLPRWKESCINSNYVRKYEIQELTEILENSNGQNYPKISDKLLKRIIEGVKASRLIGKDIKEACIKSIDSIGKESP